MFLMSLSQCHGGFSFLFVYQEFMMNQIHLWTLRSSHHLNILTSAYILATTKPTSFNFMHTLSLLLFLRKAIHIDVKVWFILPYPPTSAGACWSIKPNLIGWNPERTTRWEPRESACPLRALIYFLFPEGSSLIPEGWCSTTELEEIDLTFQRNSIDVKGELAGTHDGCHNVL